MSVSGKGDFEGASVSADTSEHTSEAVSEGPCRTV